MVSTPDVTVIVGAYNAMPYVTKCISSLREQTLEAERLDVVVVDDGSTDGTAETLDRLAADFPAMRVIHQPNSGGPAGPRNLGIDLARGRYLFFLDADDFLGVDALRRMIEMADRNSSDVVVGRRVGVGGRGTPARIFQKNVDKADLIESGLWQILSAQKLFRKSLVDEYQLRFPDLPIGQDQPFTARAYLHASTISILADYECYYLVRREDGGNNTSRQRDIRDWLRFIEIMMKLVADHLPSGDKRDALMQRHFRDEFRRVVLAERFLEATPEVQAEVLTRARALVDAYYTPAVASVMPVDGRLRVHLLSHGLLDELTEVIRHHLAVGKDVPEIVERGRAYACYPYFRDAALGVPDEIYEVTRARLAVQQVQWAPGREPAVVVAGDLSIGEVAVTLTRRDGASYRVPGRRRPDGGFEVLISLGAVAGGSPLGYGTWRLRAEFASSGTATVTRRIPRPPGMRRRLWWRGGIPSLVALRTSRRSLALAVVPLLSGTAARVILRGLRRRLSRSR